MKNIILLDIDGCIADCSHRLHYLKNKKYDSFFNACDLDTPIQAVIDFVKIFKKNNFKIIIMTSRNESCKDKTVEWLEKYLEVDYLSIYMRKKKDRRPSHQVKFENLNKINKKNIAFAIEDNDNCINMYKANNLICFNPKKHLKV